MIIVFQPILIEVNLTIESHCIWLCLHTIHCDHVTYINRLCILQEVNLLLVEDVHSVVFIEERNPGSLSEQLINVM